MKSIGRLGAGIALAVAGFASVNADEYNHRYSQGDKVNFYVHKVSPLINALA
jgi:hypothetical protein